MAGTDFKHEVFSHKQYHINLFCIMPVDDTSGHGTDGAKCRHCQIGLASPALTQTAIVRTIRQLI